MRLPTIIKLHQLVFIIAFIPLAALMTACEPENNKNSGIPTISSEYKLPTPIATPTQLPTLTPPLNPTATKELPLKTIVVFDDGFQNGWRIVSNNLVSEITDELTYQGRNSIKVTPRLGFSKLYIVSGPENQEAIPREDIITVSFYLNGGSTPIIFDDLTISAQGSNTNVFWVEDDRSAITTSKVFFQETQLAFLGITKIPANTWGRIEFEPQEQQFDPIYKYFTGFYLSNSDTLLTPYYIDRVEILMVDI